MLTEEAKQLAKQFFTSTDKWKPAELSRVQQLKLNADASFQADLKSILKSELATLSDNSNKLNETERGYRLERLIFKLSLLENLNPHPSYYVARGRPALPKEDAADGTPNGDPVLKTKRGRQPGGEQVDGSFEVDGRFFLVEAKWAKPMPASALYAFRGSVEGRLAGTLGLFVSAGDFADDADYSLIWGKEICMLLAEASDLECALEDGNSFAEMIRVKLREAARVGQVYYSYRNYVDERDA